MMNDTEYFSHLFEIASCLNKEFSLHSALRKALEKTVELLELETGWIWIMQGDNSVYLAASYNLPPALKNYPERLSGRCYCIEKYFSNKLNEAKNISEIACTRLKNIQSGTLGLKFHATVPIKIGNQKVGLINILSKGTQHLNDKQLYILNTVSELIGMAIQRTQLQETPSDSPLAAETSMHEVIKRVFQPKIKEIISNLEKAKSFTEQSNTPGALENINLSINQAGQLNGQLSHIIDESTEHQPERASKKTFLYPASPLTNRELEILALVKKGFTNKQIAEALFISERTVKFHITSILSKLSASTRTEAVNIGIKRGIIGF